MDDLIGKLSSRGMHLFRTLVELHIECGQPVSSRALAKSSGLSLSPATVRNVMADLEESGLIQSPHTSAGRVPTAKGYRLFVDTLMRRDRMNKRLLEQIVTALSYGSDWKELTRRASNVLSSVTHLAGLVMLPRASVADLTRIEFVGLSGGHVLVVLIGEGNVQNRIIHLPKSLSTKELRQCADYLNEHLLPCRHDLSKVRQALVRDMRADCSEIKQLVENTLDFAEQTYAGGGDYVLAGQTNLMALDELADVAQLRQLFENFGRKRDMLALLDQAIQTDGVHVFIGEEAGYDVLGGCSIVTSTYGVPRPVGVLGVIGPTRMPYNEVVPIVHITAQVLGEALNCTSHSSH